MADDISRRSACDRCRQQKLRCVRATIGEPCERCQKSKAICCTSQSAPIGGTKSPSRRPSTWSSIASGLPSGVDVLALNERLDENYEQLRTDASDVTMHPDLVGSNWDFAESANRGRCQYAGEIDPCSADEGWEGVDLTSFHHNINMSDVSFTDPFQFLDLPSMQKVPRSLSTQESAAQADNGCQIGRFLGQRALTIPHLPTSPGTWSDSRTSSSSEQIYEQRTQFVAPETARSYASQTLDLHRRLTKRTEEYMERRRSDMNTMAVTDSHRDTESVASSSAVSRRFIEALLCDAQAFLALLQNMQSWTVGTLPHSRASSRSLSDDSPTLQSQGPISSLSNHSTNSNKAPTRALDFQSSLAIMSCYTQTIQAFDYFFQELIARVRFARLRNSGTLSGFIPEIYIGSFHIDAQLTLQIRCLLYSSLSVLECIENILGIAPSGLGLNRPLASLFSNTQLQGLLDALFDQKDLAYEKADGTKVVRVKHTIDQLHRILNET